MNEEIEKNISSNTENNFSVSDPKILDNTSQKPKESWLDLLKFTIVTLAILLPIRFYVIQPFVVSGPSMDPQFKDGDYLIVDEISHRVVNPKRGEIIIFKKPEEKKFIIKRVIGLPGETVELNGTEVKIINSEHKDGLVLSQNFVEFPKSENPKTYKLGDDEFFVLGDNRPVSLDSRWWGALKSNEIVGRPLFRLFPFNKVSVFPGDESQSIEK
jgi:signal peptidase I